MLDVGCGRGLFLIGAARRLTTGRAIGIDIWQAEDLSGNEPAAPLNNAMIERQTAVREIARVLKVGGRVLIVDVRHLRQYARTLRDAGFGGEQDAARCVQGIVSRLLTTLTFWSVQIGYVIGSKAR